MPRGSRVAQPQVAYQELRRETGSEAIMRTWGNSLALRIPRGIAELLRLEDGTTMRLDVRDGSIILTPARPTAAEERAALVAGITPENLHDPVEWGVPLGRELL